MCKPVIDVLVIGGGPAGLSVAHRTAAAGLETLVVERQPEIARHVRTSGATATTTVMEIGAPPETYHQLEGLRLESENASARFAVERALSILDVRSFYRWLAREAVAAGAEVRVGTTARGLVTDGTGTTATLDNRASGPEQVSARIAIDASGYRAQPSRAAGLHAGFKRFGVGGEYELRAPHADPSEAVLIVSTRFAPTGYGWAFPWGSERVRVGVGVHHPDVTAHPRVLLQDLLREQQRFSLGLEDADPFEYHYGLIPAENVAPQFARKGMLAVGDAAGHASLVAGEGIRIALRAGQLAGEAAVSALREGSDTHALERFQRVFHRSFGRDLRRGAILNRRLAATGSDEQWDRRIELAATMPPEMIVGLLQSQVGLLAGLAWAAGHPRRFKTLASLMRSARH
jgi:digeranylgeranylglycerophospholipid reductase